MKKVLTHRGIIDAKDVVPGDYLYEYGTNNMLEIKDIQRASDWSRYTAKYSDGRLEEYGKEELIYFGSQMYKPHIVVNQIFQRCQPIEQYSVGFGTNKVIAPLDPDPYVAGALLGYGDFHDEYMNLPNKKDAIIDGISNKYNIDCIQEVEDGPVYFVYKGEEEKIKWIDFFGKYEFILNTVNGPLFPKEYIYARFEDRVQFIRGLFDFGYSKTVTPDTVSLTMNDDLKIKLVQKILWSLGILNNIHYFNGKFQLDILGKDEDYPGFFYDYNNIANMANTDNVVYKTNPRFFLYIETVNFSVIKPHMDDDILYFYTDKPNRLYWSANYLPRVTM